MVRSAWHYSAPLESLCMLCGLFPRPYFLGTWESGCCKNVAKAMSLLYIGHGIWLCNMENSVSHRIFGSSCIGVWELGAVLNGMSRLHGPVFWRTAGTGFSRAHIKRSYSSTLLVWLHAVNILPLRYPAEWVQKGAASRTSIRVGFWQCYVPCRAELTAWGLFSFWYPASETHWQRSVNHGCLYSLGDVALYRAVDWTLGRLCINSWKRVCSQ